MLVSQILKDKPQVQTVSVAPGTKVAEAAELLSSHRIGAVVVSTDGVHLDGILSERDIVRELGKRGTECMSDKVDDLMTAKIIGCKPDDTALEVLQMMTDGRFRHMPVMEGDAMIGLVSIGDVIKARLDELAHENDALQGMIMGH